MQELEERGKQWDGPKKRCQKKMTSYFTFGEQKKSLSEDRLFYYFWHSQGDSNPCYRREKAMS